MRSHSGTKPSTRPCHTGIGEHALIDRRVYLSASWTDDLDRCRAVGVLDVY